MNDRLMTRTLWVRSLLVLTIVGGAIAVFPHLEAGQTIADDAQITARQQLSLQLNAW
ncbi:MAG: hypothetical protein NW220_19360 [Leptolyngbyaceae cyanobacterium bins.349]|nr:hypothetical protein [Leptolyngbyaceae cyanobacterium bins.349]